MFGLGMPELLVILVIALLVFGAGKMPEVGSGLGKAIREFKRGILQAEREEEIPEEVEESEVTKTTQGIQDQKNTEGNIIDQLPGVQEMKDLQTKASTIKKWSRLLFR